MTARRHASSRVIDSHSGLCHLAAASVLACHRPDEKVALVELMSHLLSGAEEAVQSQVGGGV